MNEEKINQILKNQQNIISAISKLIKEEKPTVLMEALDEVYWETVRLLNPIEKEKTSIEISKDKTEDALSEDSNCEVKE